MDQVKLVAAARFKHDGRQLFPKDKFVASEREAADLLTLRFAVRDPDQSSAPPPQEERESVVLAEVQDARGAEPYQSVPYAGPTPPEQEPVRETKRDRKRKRKAKRKGNGEDK